MQACERYEAAWRLREASASALYNWGVALSDMSRVVKGGDRAAAHDYLLSAAEKYATSLRWNPNNPQVGGPACSLLSMRSLLMQVLLSCTLLHGHAVAEELRPWAGRRWPSERPCCKGVCRQRGAVTGAGASGAVRPRRR